MDCFSESGWAVQAAGALAPVRPGDEFELAYVGSAPASGSIGVRRVVRSAGRGPRKMSAFGGR
jgi:hypothetical protein